MPKVRVQIVGWVERTEELALVSPDAVDDAEALTMGAEFDGEIYMGSGVAVQTLRDQMARGRVPILRVVSHGTIL